MLNIKRNFREKDTKGLISSFDQETKRKSNSNTFNGKAGMDYFAGKNTTFGIVVTGFTSDQNRTNNTYTDIYETKTGTLSKQSGVSREEQEWKNFSTNLNIRQVLDTTGEELTADLDFIRYNSDNATALLNYYFDGGGAITNRPDTLVGSLPQDITIYSGKMDYLLPLKKGAKF